MTDPDNIRLNKNLGGGALLDAGSYPVSLVRMIAGCAPVRVHAVAAWSRSGVDQSVVATLEHDDGLLAQISCSFDTAVHRHALIAGTEGTIDTTYSNHTSPDRPATLSVKRGTSWTAKAETIDLPTSNGFLAELEAFADLIESGERGWTGATPDDSIDIASTLDAIMRSAQHGRRRSSEPRE